MILMRSSLIALSLVLSFSALADNWPHWRGPHFNGSTTEKDLPVQFSKTENVKWTAELPGPSAATAIIWNDHVFLSSTDEKDKTLHALALDRKTGRVFGTGGQRWFCQDNYSNFASPSPTTDGEIVVFLYGNGELAAFDFAGKTLEPQPSEGLWSLCLPMDLRRESDLLRGQTFSPGVASR